MLSTELSVSCAEFKKKIDKKKKKETNRKTDSHIVDINPAISINILNAND